MVLHVEFDRETDDRWIADVVDLPGVIAYGDTRAEALAAAKALALRVLADRLEHGEIAPSTLKGVEFSPGRLVKTRILKKAAKTARRHVAA